MSAQKRTSSISRRDFVGRRWHRSNRCGGSGSSRPGGQASQHRRVGLEGSVLHELPIGVRQQCRPGIGLGERGVLEDRRRVRLLPLAARDQLVSPLHP